MAFISLLEGPRGKLVDKASNGFVNLASHLPRGCKSIMNRWDRFRCIAHGIHVWHFYLHLFTIRIYPMQVNMPYMDPPDYVSHCLHRSRALQDLEKRVLVVFSWSYPTHIHVQPPSLASCMCWTAPGKQFHPRLWRDALVIWPHRQCSGPFGGLLKLYFSDGKHMIPMQGVISEETWYCYCWWKKSCTSWMVNISVFARFCTSLVVQDFFHQQYLYCICFLMSDVSCDSCRWWYDGQKEVYFISSLPSMHIRKNNSGYFRCNTMWLKDLIPGRGNVHSHLGNHLNSSGFLKLSFQLSPHHWPR